MPIRNQSTTKSLITLLRPHQWAKNCLVFAPLFFFESWSWQLFTLSAEAFIAFCFGASAAYCLNDVLDVAKDREHPKKKHRPVASGALSAITAAVVGAILASLSLLLSWNIGQDLFLVLLIYLAAQLAYSFGIKRLPLIDILFLATLYVIRVLAGVAATGIAPSTWILTCTWLVALMVATGKRYAEVQAVGDDAEKTRPVLLEYSPFYLRNVMTSMGSVSLVSYLLWCHETVGVGRFTALEIFPTAFFVTFGILRYQLLVFHKRFDEDPTRGFVMDPPILLTIISFVAYLAFVIYV